MKSGHDGDCSYYAAYDQRGDPIEAGICSCGYGLQQLRIDGSVEHLYSPQRRISELQELIRLKNREIKALEGIINGIAKRLGVQKAEGGSWLAIDGAIDELKAAHGMKETGFTEPVE